MKDSQLTQDIYDSLKQGSKIEFKWYGNSELLYVGRIEVNNNGEKYFVAEHNYSGDAIRPECEGMRFYNSLQSFYCFTYFKLIEL